MKRIDITAEDLVASGPYSEALLPYSRLTDRQLNADGLFIVESPKVIATALGAGYEPVSLLCEERHIDGDAADVIARMPDEAPLFTGPRDALQQLTGYTLTRGVLCAMRRPAARSAAEVCAGARRVAVIDGVCDTTNIGSIFRSAAALGIDAVLLTPTACDPLNRRSVRVSMGTVMQVPWARIGADVPAEMRALGFATAAMALVSNSEPLDSPRLMAEPRLAVVLGTEGDGLAASVIAGADYAVCIPMAHGVDSLNVGAAAAVAFWQLRIR